MINLVSVSYTYPRATSPAVRNVSLRVKPGELVLCTGRSGCGKSTLLRIINGLAPKYLGGELLGRVLVNGLDNASRELADIGRDCGTLFQNPESQFFALTVEDEAAVCLERRKLSPEERQQAVSEALERMGIADIATRSVLYLSEGQKQKVAMAGLLAASPCSLILDEPSANLDPESAADLARTLARLKSDGMAILVVDHRLFWLRDVVDRVVVMDDGAVAEEGPFSILDDAAMRGRLGLREAAFCDPRADLTFAAEDECAAGLTVEGMNFAYARQVPLFREAKAYFAPGRITALLGPNGCGKTTLARLFTGLLKPKTARFRLGGTESPARERLRRLGLVLQNADHQLRMRTVREELADSVLGLETAEAQRRIDDALREYSLEHLADRHPQSLSGGEKQRLSVAAAMIRHPEAVFLDEPTSGLDGANMLRVAEDLGRAAKRGAAVVVITHDLEFMRIACDRAFVLGDLPAQPLTA